MTYHHGQGPWAFPLIQPAYNSMTTTRGDQQEASPTSIVQSPYHWTANLEPPFRGASLPDSQDWSQTFQPSPKLITMQNNQQNAYPEPRHTAYPDASLLSPTVLYQPFPQNWASSPGADSHSSALSPRSDRDYSHDMSAASSPLAALPLTRTHSGGSALSHDTDMWSGGAQFPLDTIHMAEIQQVPDPDEVPDFRDPNDTFTDDDDTGEQESIIVIHRPSYASDAHHSFPLTNNQPSHRFTSQLNLIEEQDADADAECDPDEPHILDDADPDYVPNPRRRSHPARTVKRHRNTQASRTPASRLHAVTSPGTSRVTKRRPASSARSSRPTSNAKIFPCTFAFAGCPAEFAAKNEWKRHVASQHTCFWYWVCKNGACGTGGRCTRFNRKDLFTQHLRRMHGPRPSPSTGGRSSITNSRVDAWEQQLVELQADGKRQGRQAITKVSCPVPECVDFNREGSRAWEERMEHVASHWLDASRGKEPRGWTEEAGGLLEWALREGVVRDNGAGGWELVEGDVGDADAEGEME